MGFESRSYRQSAGKTVRQRSGSAHDSGEEWSTRPSRVADKKSDPSDGHTSNDAMAADGSLELRKIGSCPACLLRRCPQANLQGRQALDHLHRSAANGTRPERAIDDGRRCRTGLNGCAQ